MELFFLLLLPSLTLASSMGSSSGSDEAIVDETPSDSDTESPENDEGVVINGSALDDMLIGTEADDRLRGNDGDDQLFGLGGDDTLRGGAGDDTLIGATGEDLLRGGEDDDVLMGDGGADTLTGDSGDDILFGRDTRMSTSDLDAPYSDILSGLSLDEDAESDDGDVLQGGRNGDLLLMGGDDTASGGLGEDWFVAFDDNVSEATVTDYDPEDDLLVLGYSTATAPDIMIGDDGAGNATVLANGELMMTVEGMAGQISVDDIALIDRTDSDAELTMTGTAGDDSIDSPNSETVVDGAAGDDTIMGSPGDDNLLGGSGSDEINGGHGNDLIQGGTGADSLDGAPGDDTILGGSGDDVISAGNTHGYDALDGGEGDDTITGNRFDTLVGAEGDDYLEVSGTNISASDTIGDPGVLYGEAILDGGAGNDTLAISIDRVQASSGEAFLTPSTLTGGDGADTFMVDIDLADAGDSINLEGSTAAVITDYTPGEDVIVLQSDIDLGDITVVPQEDGDALVMLGDRGMILVAGAADTLTTADVRTSLPAA